MCCGCIYVFLLCSFTIEKPSVTPTFAILFPGEEVLFTCNTTVVIWSINGTLTASSAYPTGVRIFNTTTLAVNMSDNATTYACGISDGQGDITKSNTATLVLAG